MKTKLMHEYAVGNIHAITIGNLKSNVERTFDLKKALSSYSKRRAGNTSLIVLPEVIGVYRRIIMGVNFSPESDMEQALEESDEDTLGIHLSLNVQDKPRIDPNLVQVGYDYELFKLNFIIDFLGYESNRMIVVPYQQLKPAGEDLLKYSELTYRRLGDVLKGKQPTKEDRGIYLNLVKRMLQTEGLMRPEFDMFMNSEAH